MAKTILLADDSVTIQKVVELTFMDQDYQVTATGDGTSALEQLPALGPHLVIADVHMPGADGYEVCRQTKERHPEIPVLLLVGTFEQFDEAKAAAVGADGHLKKPFDSQDLLSQVESLIARSGAAEAAPPPAAAWPTAMPPAEADVFGAAQPLVGNLEPPSLETSAAPAGDVWGALPGAGLPGAGLPGAGLPDAGLPDAGLPAVEAAPVAEPEAPAFTTSPVDDFAASPPMADLDQDVTDTAAVDLGAIGTAPEPPAFGLVPPAEVESVDELPAAVPMAAPMAAEPEPAALVEKLEAPSLELPSLEAPSLEAPPIEDFAPFDDEPAVEEAPEPWAPVMEPEPLMEAAPEAAEVVDEPAFDEPAFDEPIAAEPAAVAPAVEEPESEDSAVAEPAAEEPAVAEPVAEAAVAEPATPAAANGSGPLSDDDVERIARRVAELMGEKALQDVAWEVLPDLAEVIIKERIRELESQVV